MNYDGLGSLSDCEFVVGNPRSPLRIPKSEIDLASFARSLACCSNKALYLD